MHASIEQWNATGWCVDNWAALQPWLGRPCPARLCTAKGTQFVVAASAVRRLPREFYARLDAIHHELPGGRPGGGAPPTPTDAASAARQSEHELAMAFFFEWVHHVFFGEEDCLRLDPSVITWA